MPDFLLTALAQTGLFGPIVAYLIYRDNKERDRYIDREDRLDAKIDGIVMATNNLVRVTATEVLTREHVVDRMKDETRELLRSIERGG